MSNKTETIDELRNILIDGSNNLYLEGKFDRKLFADVLDCLNLISNENLKTLSNEVYGLLSSEDNILRSEAIATLGFSTRLFLPEFKDKAYNIFINDLDESVKFTALVAWAGYYFNTPNEKVLTVLYKTLKDEKNDIALRAQACGNIFSTAKGNCPEYYKYAGSDSLLNSKTPDEFNSKIDWKAIEKIMKEFAPGALR